MGSGGAAHLALLRFTSASVDRQPVWPIPAQVEEIIEVAEAGFLEIFDHLRNHVLGWQRTDRHQILFDVKLFIGEIVSLIDR